MYALETAEMSSEGRLAVPDSFRKRYGWKAGMTFLLVGTADSVVVQPFVPPDGADISRFVHAISHASEGDKNREDKAKSDLAEIDDIGLDIPVGIDEKAAWRDHAAGKYA